MGDSTMHVLCQTVAAFSEKENNCAFNVATGFYIYALLRHQST